MANLEVTLDKVLSNLETALDIKSNELKSTSDAGRESLPAICFISYLNSKSKYDNVSVFNHSLDSDELEELKPSLEVFIKKSSPNKACRKARGKVSMIAENMSERGIRSKDLTYRLLICLIALSGLDLKVGASTVSEFLLQQIE